ncbi:MAG TPA: PQQ-dependent sugar dehydrogenase, partial [Candidatus Kapabacteria bacterium]|nr:PQQ-dependent sugar dehydrogenase [Candidatus Kapabacteria bacterium]
MKQALIFFAVIAAGCSRNVATPPAAQAQTSRGCALAAWVMQQQPHSTRTLEAPPPLLRDTVITVNGVQQKISIPAGFTMTVFAGNVPKCRGLALSPDGVIYATTYNGDVDALPDHNHDGVADSTVVVISGLGSPDCVGFFRDSLYVSNTTGLYRLVTNSSSRAAIAKVEIASLPPSNDHSTRNFVFDTTNNKIYVEIGSNGNMDTSDYAHCMRIVQMNIDGSGYRSYASGLRNPEGMDFDPRTGALWANMNGMDDIFGSGTQLTDNNPSEGIYLICDGANYGYPWCYGFQMRNPQQPWVNLDTNIVKTFDGPVAEVLAHSAPLSLHFYRGTKFPAMYHNAIFQCYHGSWDRTPPAPPRITVMFADTDGKNARVTDFVNGFFVMGSKPDSTDGKYFGRPVQIIEGADSALYVSDDQAGAIYRIAYTGAPSSVSNKTSGESFEVGPLIPNPASNQFQTQITVDKPEYVQAALFDVLGNEVRS